LFITVGAMKTAMEWSSRRARHSLVPLCRIVATLEDGPCRDALLEPLLEALPSMAGVSDQELAAHAVSAAKHVSYFFIYVWASRLTACFCHRWLPPCPRLVW